MGPAKRSQDNTMKILFVYPNIVESPKDISRSLAILSALCREKGHEVCLIDTTFGLKESEIVEKAKNFNPDLIAITTATNDFNYSMRLCHLLKRSFVVPIIAGGYHPTISPEEVLSQKCIDIVCVGEGEEALLELLNAMEKKESINKIRNLWIKVQEKGKTRIIKNPIRSLIQNLDGLPFPDRELFDYKKYLKWNHGTATFLFSRGCPFNCTYCINSFLTRLNKGKGRYVRFRSVDNLLREIKEVMTKYGSHIKNVEFYDDTFTLNEEKVMEFCKKYKEEIDIPFNLNARVNAVNPELFKLLKEAGCVRVTMAIESGDEFIRNKVLKRNMSDKQIISTFRSARKAGLKVYALNMVGIPFETKEAVNKTIELNRKCKPHYVGVSIFNAFKGIELYDVCKKNNWLRDKYAKSFFRDSNVKHPNFSIAQLRRIRNSFGFKVFLTYNFPRALVDIIDRNMSQINSYILLRSKIIEKLNLLRK